MPIVLGALMPHPPIMLEAVGCGEEKKVSATIHGARTVGKMIGALKPDTIVIVSPHGPVFSDALTIRYKKTVEGDLAVFGASEMMLNKQVDLEFIDILMQESFDADVPVALFDHALSERFQLDESMDHGVLVPLSFVESNYSTYQIVVIHYGLLSPLALYRFGKLIQKTSEICNRRVAVIASGDLSHRLKDYGHYVFDSRGPQFDKQLLEMLQCRDVEGILTMDENLVAGAGECGKKAIDILLGTLDGFETVNTLHSYEGPFGVGYGVMTFDHLEDSVAFNFENRLEKAFLLAQQARVNSESLFVKLARQAIEYFVKERKVLEIPDIARVPALMCESQGTFVSIKTAGGLRGCIGTTEGTERTLAEEIISNAIKACSEDPRFSEIEEHELDDLRLSVDVLSPLEPIQSEESLDPHLYGVVVVSRWKKGLLLPNLEGIETVDEQLKIAKNKAGIDPHETVDLYRFTVERHV